ncbi:MAG TPA: MMPL family transporter [Solirubrobacterales bacterium]|nr:MMPL family transporter [Solirubrobacterales bacterium]
MTAALAFQGLGLDQKASIHPIYVGGTEATRAHEITLREFGVEDTVIVMLRGPRAAVEGQGRELTRRLEAMPRSQVTSPWTPGAAIAGLRPSPRIAGLAVSTERPKGEDSSDIEALVQRRVDETVREPVQSSMAGTLAVLDSFRSASDRATAVGELIAVPVLLFVLLFVFRSVLAAAIPLVIGGAVVASTRGVLSLLAGVVPVDAFALGVVGMMGLALGVDYSLLVISRYREELSKGEDASDAVREALTRAGRAIIPAGSGLVLALAVSSQLVPGTVAKSVAAAVIVATILSVLSAMLVTPALLMLLGTNLDRWSLRQRRRGQTATLRWFRLLSNHPRAVVPIVLVLLLCAVRAFALDSELSTVALLPSGDSGRRQLEEVQRGLGPGWIAPMEIVMDGRGAPVTSPDRLRALADFQRRVGQDHGVAATAGFSEIERGARQLDGVEHDLVAQKQGLARLSSGISRAHNGAALNAEGLLQAAGGARELGAGLGATHTGAGFLSDGLRSSADGSSRLTLGLGRASEGSGQLAQGTSKASGGIDRLSAGLAKTQEGTSEISSSAHLFSAAMRSGNERLAELDSPLQAIEAQLEAARQALLKMTTGHGDPEYGAALLAVEEAGKSLTGTGQETSGQPTPPPAGIDAGVKRAEGQFNVGLYLAARLNKSGHRASDGIRKLARSSARLDRGLRRLAANSNEMSDGLARLSRGGQTITPGLQGLSAGAERLVDGLAALETGAGGLSGGLGGGAQKSKLLTGALHRIGSGIERQQSTKPGGRSQLEELRKQSPGLFHSGYFYMAGIDGSPPARRERASFLISLDRGGSDARMLVIPRYSPGSMQAEETRNRLQGDAHNLARETGTDVFVGGAAARQMEANHALRDGAPLLRLVLSLITFFVLVPVVRSLTVPLIAALVNLVTVSATFGLMSFLFNGSLLGGPGYIDVAIVPATLMVMFGLAIDYEVFIFARIREEYVRTGSPEAAIENGVGQTAQVVGGAATIMIAVFLAFSVSPFMTVRNFGVAQAIAVFIDAFIVRLVIVPALMRVMGRWSWWLPGWLDRLLPGSTPSVGPAMERVP